MEFGSTVKALSAQIAAAPLETRQQARQQLLTALDALRQGKVTPVPTDVIDDTLAMLELPNETFAYVVVLALKAAASNTATQLFAQQAARLITLGSEEDIRASPEAFKLIARVMADTCIASDLPAAAVHLLETAIRKLQPTREHVTPIHADFVKVALLSRHYHAALPVLDHSLFEVDPSATALDPKDSLLYFYYGGMVYIGAKQFEKASDFLLMAVTSPAQAFSAIVVEAHKKYCLVSLLLTGQIPALPKFTSAVVSRSVGKTSEAYMDLGKALQSNKADEVEKTVSKYRAEFEKDRNMGLVMQVVESVTRHNIQRLTRTFVTLSLADIAKAARLPGPAEAQAYLLRMIENREIFATIDQTNQMVSFQGAPDAYDSSSTSRLLDERLHSAIALGDRISLLDKRIAVSEDFLKRAAASDRADARSFDPDDSDLPSERMSGGMRLQ